MINKNFFIYLTFVVSIFLFDRLSKLYVISLDKDSYSSELLSSKFLNINLIWNKGIAFGFLSFDQNKFYNLVTLIIVAAVIIIFLMSIKSDYLKRYALLMIFSGAVGNLYDRFFYKAVPDFIDFHIGEFHWFIFNVADIFISVGVIFMILLELIDNKNNDEYQN